MKLRRRNHPLLPPPRLAGRGIVPIGKPRHPTGERMSRDGSKGKLLNSDGEVSECLADTMARTPNAPADTITGACKRGQTMSRVQHAALLVATAKQAETANTSKKKNEVTKKS